MTYRATSAIFIASLLVSAATAISAQTEDTSKMTIFTPTKEVEITLPSLSNDYHAGEDSKFHPGVPKGTVFDFILRDSRSYPGTSTKITVYVPAQYKASDPACLFVLLDSFGYNGPAVFDNLIAQHAMPVAIGVGIGAGVVDSVAPPDDPRYERSMEFDSRGDRFAKFLIDEVLPAVEQHKTPDGRTIRLSKDPNDRGIGGGSTGGIGAFTVAWERPDSFRRVFTSIGTFVGMRGGEEYHVLVRKTEPKPIRIFMQDGVYDNLPSLAEVGDWHLSNETMERALNFAGYDVQHVWGVGNHNGSQAAALFPDAMRWLWRDWPKPILAGASADPELKAVLQPGETWQIAMEKCAGPAYLAADDQGKVYFSARVAGQDRPSPVPVAPAACSSVAGVAGAIAFGPDGHAYLADDRQGGGLLAYNAKARLATLVPHIDIKGLFVAYTGDIYASVRSADGKGELWMVHADGRSLKLAGGLKGAAGVAITPDDYWLFAAQHDTHLGYSYQVQKDGTLAFGEPFYDFYVPVTADDSGAGSVTMDRDGRAYVATRMGVQVFEHNGRVVAILPLPGGLPATSLCFGGSDFSTLYVSSGDEVFMRKLKVSGLGPGARPIKLPKGGGG
jgi:predicted alpha/beta superfamily hydrolase